MKAIHLRQTQERGQSIVLIALMITGLVAFVGLALDGGQVFEMRRQAQNAADAGALAGANEMFSGSTALTYYRINQYAVGNSTVGNQATDFTAWYYSKGGGNLIPVKPGILPHPGTNCVRVTTSKSFNTLIISFLGFNSLTVSATASACGQPVFPAVVWPIAVYNQTLVDEQTFQFNQTYSLLGDGQAAPGQFAWLSYDDSDAATALVPKVENGYAGPFVVYNSSQGLYDLSPCSTSTSSTRQAVDNLYFCLKGTPGAKAVAEKAAESLLNKIIIVPFYNTVQVQAPKTYYHIIGFAAFKVTGICMQGLGVGDCSGPSGKKINGQFVRYAVNGLPCDEETSNCGFDGGLRIARLNE